MYKGTKHRGTKVVSVVQHLSYENERLSQTCVSVCLVVKYRAELQYDT